MNASKLSLAIIVLVLCSLVGAVHGATYYVAQEAPDASDDNPGSEDKPWKTLTHAAYPMPEALRLTVLRIENRA